MTTTAPPPGVYHSRSRITRTRLLLAGAGLALLLLGYVIGRVQGGGGPETPAAAAVIPPPATSAAPSSPPSPPPSPSPSLSSAPAGLNPYNGLQAEAASGQQGTEFQDTEDEGGGQNVGWINNGDWLRYDNVDFGDSPATGFLARVASDVDDDARGRIEIRLDSPSNEPAGTMEVQDTDGWQDWETQATDIKPVTGRHTLFITFASNRDIEFLNVNFIAFTR